MRKMIDRYLQKFNIRYEQIIQLSLFVIFIVTALYPFSNITFTTNDDFRVSINSLASPLGAAIGQGRFPFLYQVPVSRIPFLFENLFVFQIIKNLSHILLLAIICYSVYKITKSKKISLLIFTLFFAWLQNSNTYNLINSYILLFHIPLISIFLALIVFEKYSIKKSYNKGLLIFLLTFYGISGYESFVFFLCLAPFFDQSSMIKNQIWSKIKIYLPFIAAAVVYGAITILWKAFFPTNYDGNTLDISFADIPMALRVCYQFTIAALPTYFFFYQKFFMYNFIDLLKMVNPVTLINVLVTFLLSASILLKKESKIILGKKRLISLVILLIPLAFSFNSLYGLTPKYRDWVSTGSSAYVGTFFSTICFTIFFAIVIWIFINTLHKKIRPLSQLLCISVIAFGISFISLLIGISNQNVNIQETDMTSKLQLIDQFVASDIYSTLNENDIIIGQTLFEGIPGFSSNDWTDYLQYKTGKRINILKSREDMPVINYNRLLQMNIIKVDSNPFNNVLVVSEVIPNVNDLSKTLYLYSNSSGVLNVIGRYYSDNKSLFKVNSSALLNFSCNIETFSAQVSPASQNRGYSTEISTEEPYGIDSIQVTRNINPFNLSNTSIIWGKGFYELEKNPEHRWSQKDSTITIVNSSLSPILIKISGYYSTGYAETTFIQMKSNLFSDTIQVNNIGTYWEKQIELPPGNTQINFSSDAKKVIAPNDPREMFFSVNSFNISKITETN